MPIQVPFFFIKKVLVENGAAVLWQSFIRSPRSRATPKRAAVYLKASRCDLDYRLHTLAEHCILRASKDLEVLSAFIT